MRLKINFKKVTLALALIMIFSLTFIGNITYGKTNTVYKTSGEVGSIDVDQAVTDAPILEGIARMIYAIAGYIEEIVGYLVSIFTGVKMFPWADRVIFNTMPLLDINFLSPEPGSLFAKFGSGAPTDLGKIVQNIYYTIFTLSVTFFGVVVGIMALKLAISSIAAEKAKYKQAITNWLLALILLFTAHYLMSFIFFINEKMVEVASSVIMSQDIDFKIDVDGMKDEEISDVIHDILSETTSGGSYDIPNSYTASLIFYSPDGVPDDTYYTGGHAKSDAYIKEVERLVKYYPSADQIKSAYTGAVGISNFKSEYPEIWKEFGGGDDYAGGDDVLGGYGADIIAAAADELGGYTPEEITGELNAYGNHIFSIKLGDNDDKEDDDGGEVEEWGIKYFTGYVDWAVAYKDKIDDNTNKVWSESDWSYHNEWVRYIMQVYADSGIISKLDVEAEEDCFVIFIDAAYIYLLDKYYGLSEGKISEDDFIDGITNLAKHIDEHDGAGSQYDPSCGHDEHYETLWNHVQKIYTFSSDGSDDQVFTGMADFFKNAVTAINVYEIKDEDDETEMKISNFNPIPAILYSIFVIQSIMYFIAYLKRFFYILVLALFAPLVIIYDFLTKTAMG